MLCPFDEARMALEELLRRLWRRRWGILLSCVLLYALAAALVWNWPRSFVATAIVAPSETTGIATSSLLTPSPFLQPSLLDQRPGGNFAVYLAALRAPEAAAALARDTPLLPRIEERRAAWPLGPLRRLLGLRMVADTDDALTFLERNFAATPSLTSVTWTLELVDRDRAAALDMLQRLHALAEARVRETLAELAGRRIQALEARLRIEPDLFLRNSLFELLAQQQRAALVVAADEAAAARIVSVPMVEIRPSVPNRPLLRVLLAIVIPGVVLLTLPCRILLRREVPEWPASLPWREPVEPRGRVEPVLTRTPTGDGAC
ncbi:MAG: Wzz/FepE/Etk N-terminal domain-containing protein [Roseococcus sp.]